MHFRQLSVLLWVGILPYPPYTFAIGPLMLCYLIPPVSEWGETTVYHHRACLGVKNRRYTRLRKAFTARRQASHGDEGHEGREAPEQGRPEGDTIDTVAASV